MGGGRRVGVTDASRFRASAAAPGVALPGVMAGAKPAVVARGALRLATSPQFDIAARGMLFIISRANVTKLHGWHGTCFLAQRQFVCEPI